MRLFDFYARTLFHPHFRRPTMNTEANDIVVEAKEDAVVADAKTECSGQRSIQRRDVAAAGAGMVKNDLEGSEGGGSINLACIGRSFGKRGTRTGHLRQHRRNAIGILADSR